MKFLQKSENLIFLIISFFLSTYYYRLETRNLVFNVIYEYQNRYYTMQKLDSDWTNFSQIITSGFFRHLIQYLRTDIGISPMLFSGLILILTFLFSKLLYGYILYFLPKSSSLLIVSIIFLTPLSGALREILLKATNGNFYGFLFGHFPSPYLSLIGLVLTLSFYHRYRLSVNFPLNKGISLALMLFLIHPFHFILFLCSFMIQFKALNFRGLGSLKINVLNLLVLGITSLVIFSVVSLSFMSDIDFLGTITLQRPAQVNPFVVFFYILTPLAILALSLYVINISLRELFLKFYPIFICFCFELFLILFSIVVSRDLTSFLQFNGLSQTFHVLYYVPTVYVVMSINRRRRIRWINHEKYGLHLELLLFRFIPTISWILIALILSTSAWQNKNTFVPKTDCAIVKQVNITLERRGVYGFSDAEVRNRLYEVRKYILDKEDFKAFMEVPSFDSNVNYRDQLCNTAGLGFLVLNGMNFDQEAVNNSQDFLNVIEETLNDK
jgi:hypothetical protein